MGGGPTIASYTGIGTPNTAAETWTHRAMMDPSDDKTLPGPSESARVRDVTLATLDGGGGGVVVGGRYLVHERIASSGMATIHLGTSTGAEGFMRVVAVKRLLPELCTDPEMVAMFIDEARIGAAVRHTNVVATIDLVRDRTDVSLVMEHVDGASLLALLRAGQLRGERVPRGIAVAVVVDLLRGLHAAHTAVNAFGVPLEIVHRDVSPSNVLVGADGTTRVIDFGIAAARGRLHETRAHETGVKGKLVYLAPEQILGERADARTDVYAAGVVLWELVTGERLFHGENDLAIAAKILAGEIAMPSTLHTALAPFDEVLRHAVAKERDDRFPNALEMARAVERCGVSASRDDVAAWLEHLLVDAASVTDAHDTHGRSMRASRDEARAKDAAAHFRSALRTLVERSLAAREQAEGLASDAASVASRLADRIRPHVDPSMVAVVVLIAVACVSLAAALSAAPVR